MTHYNDPAADAFFLALDSIKQPTAAENDALVVRAQAGDDDARAELIERNMRLVVYVAKRYHHAGSMLTLMDRIQDGVVGMGYCIDSYKPNHNSGSTFATYALKWIRNEVIAQGRMAFPVSLPKGHADKHITPATQAQRLNAAKRTGSLSDFHGGYDGAPGGTRRQDLLKSGLPAPDAGCRAESDRALAEKMLESLGDYRKEHIMRSLYFCQDHEVKTTYTLGDELGVSHQRITQLKDEAIKQLNRAFGRELDIWKQGGDR